MQLKAEEKSLTYNLIENAVMTDSYKFIYTYMYTQREYIWM